jgi:hypothetical protein
LGVATACLGSAAGLGQRQLYGVLIFFAAKGGYLEI